MTRRWLAPLTLALLAACAQADAGDTSADAATAPSVYEPSEADRTAVVGALQVVFDALESGDADLLRSVLDPDILMQYTETNAAGETTYGSSTLDGLAERIESSEQPLIERMWSPEVRVDGSLATIWAPYDFYSGSTFSHCGIDAATLVEREDGWKIVALSWTRLQPPACALHPEGPPAS